MIADMIHNKNLNSRVIELFIRGRNWIIFIAKIPNKGELQQIAINHSSDISTKDFTNIYKKCTDKPCFSYWYYAYIK